MFASSARRGLASASRFSLSVLCLLLLTLLVAVPSAWAQAVTGLTISPTSVTTGNSATGTVTLASPAIGNQTIFLTGDTLVTVSATVTVIAGQTSATFPITTAGPPSVGVGHVTATKAGGVLPSTAYLNLTPVPPSGLTAIAGSGQVSLSWTASGYTTDSYNIYRSTVSGSGYVKVNASSVTTTSYTDTGLTGGTTYYYVVTAVRSGFESVNSNQASATPTGALVLTSITVAPATAALHLSSTQAFTTTAKDQFGNALSPQPTITWSATGGGSVSPTTGGSTTYTAPSTVPSGAVTVTATSGAVSGTASVTVTNGAPTVAMPAAATPNPVTGTTTALSVLGADDGGESHLTYTWATTGTPPAAVTFSVNGTNAAKNTTATFTKAGSYSFQVNLTDAGGLTVTSSVTVTVNQTLTTITVTPNPATVATSGTQTFTATAKDQFGAALTTQPGFTWSVTGVGSITSTGLYSAGTTAGTAVVKATSGSVNGTAAVTVTAAPDFGVSLSPTTLSVAQGGNGTSAVTVTASGGFAGVVTLSATGLPSGVTAGFVPATLTGSGTSTLTLTASGTATVGTATVTVKGVSGALMHTAPLSLTVTATGGVPAAPTGLAGVAGNRQVNLTWNTVTGTGITYSVYVGTATGAEGATPLVKGLTSPNYLDTRYTDGGKLINGRTYFYKVTASNAAGESVKSTEASATPTTPAPTITPNGGSFTGPVAVTLTDAGATIFYTTTGAVPTSASTRYQGPFILNATTTVKAIAYAPGSTAGSAVSSAVFTITAGSGSSASASLSSPTDGSILPGTSSGATTITGTVSGSNLSAWEVDYRLSQGSGTTGPWTILNAGTSAVSGGTLGTLDTTLLTNGIYQLRAVAYDKAGGVHPSGIVSVVVKSDQKVGYFTVSYNDLTVPIAGIPISITRTYDSRNKSGGDFGVGWTLSTGNVHIQKNGPVGGNASDVAWGQFRSGSNYSLSLLKSRLITITLPNGDIYNFQPVASPASQSFFPYTDTGANIQFQPADAATKGTLVDAANTSGAAVVVTQIPDGSTNPLSVELDNTDLTPYDPTEFILTLRNGRKLDITIANGIQTITDLTGNILTFNYSGAQITGITSSLGPALTFTRTGNYITQIKDLNGVPLNYTQTNGDLTDFYDRANNHTVYSYDYAHTLIGIQDPSGNQPLRNDYFPDGRLQDTIDATGSTIYYHYPASVEPSDPAPTATNTQQVIDRLGHKTELVYDTYGNVTSKTVHLIDGTGDHAITTTSQFGDSSNPDKKTQETDPLGRVTNYSYLTTGELQTVTQSHLVMAVSTPVTTTYSYNGYGQVLTVRDANNNVATTNNYNANGTLNYTQDALLNKTSYAYNTNGTLATTTDAATPSHTTYFYYDGKTGVYPAGVYLTRTVDALGHTTTFDYDANGNKVSQVQTRTNPVTMAAESLLTRYTYDANDRLIVTDIYAANSTTTIIAETKTFYNSLGKVDHTLDAGGRTTTYQYDSQGRLYETDYQDGTNTQTFYDANGQRVASKDRAGRYTGVVYDTLGRQTASGPLYPASPFNPDGSLHFVTDGNSNALVSRTVYDNAGQVTQEFDANNNRGTAADKATVTTYDDLGRKVAVTDPAGAVTTYNDPTDSGYDLNGNQLQVKDARGNSTKFVYDADNRQVETDLYKADGTTLLTRSLTSYDALGRRQTSTTGAAGVNPDSRTTTYAYDELGRLKTVTTPGAHTATYGYDEIGEKIRQTDANSHVTKFAYDERGHVARKTLPGLGFESFTYNMDGSLNTHTDFNGLVTTSAYDPASGRLLSQSTGSGAGQWVAYDYYPGGARFHAYRGHGAVLPANTDSTLTSTYDADRGLLTGVTAPGGTLTYAYDNAGNKTSLTSPSGSTTYDYDLDNRLFHVKRGGSTVATYGYDANGNRQSLALLNGVTTTYTYDEANRLTKLVNAKGGTTLSSYAYTLYASGKRKVLTDSTGATITYAYDSDGRLTTETSVGLTPAIANTYGYDAVGNRISLNAATITYDTNDRLTTAGHTYDANGNETTVNGQAATYDFQNHLASVGTSTYAYDADGNRLSVTTSAGTTKYLVSNKNVLEETDPLGSVTRYDYGANLLRLDRSGTVFYYLYDGLGSVRQLTNSTGAPTDSYLYDGYGVGKAKTGTTANNFLYQGQQFDAASGDYYLRARYYDPTAGRFLSQDPFDGFTDNPISLHRYLYASSDPINFTDPSGYISDAVIGTKVHQVIGIDFELGSPTTRKSNYISFTAILNELGIPGIFSEDQPDLIDTAAQFVFEIKANNKREITKGALKLDGYIGILNTAYQAAGRFPGWHAGEFNDYYYNNVLEGGPIITKDKNGLPLDNKKIVVYPPIDGLILYKVIDLNDQNGQTELAVEKAYANQLIAEQSAGVDLVNQPPGGVPGQLGFGLSAASIIASQAQLITGEANVADALVASGRLAIAAIAASRAQATTELATDAVLAVF